MKEVIRIPVIDVIVPPRARQDMGDIDALAASIDKLGLLQPIGVTEANVLIFGERRLRAHMKLGRTEIEASVIDIASLAEGERDENEVRKDFTPSERVAIGHAVEKQMGERRGNPNLNAPIPDHGPELEKGKETRELAAKRAGFGSGKTYERAKRVVEQGAPELVEAMDKEQVTIRTAERLVALPKEVQAEIAKAGPDAIERESHRMRQAAEENRADVKAAKESLKIGTLRRLIEELVELSQRPQHRYPYLQIKSKADELRAAFAKAFPANN